MQRRVEVSKACGRDAIMGRMIANTMVLLVSLFATGASGAAPQASDPGRYFAIEVVDEQTGRGVPMVELQTTSSVRYYTDSNGLVAFDEPGLMGRKVFFGVSAHGYEFATDGFGIRGVVAGDQARRRPRRLKIKRLNIAERLYRITGQGIYRDTVLLGRKPPIAEPLLNAEVTGQDGILNAVYRGKLYWFYGDTGRLSYALGNFSMTGRHDRPAGQDRPGRRDSTCKYFAGKDGFARPMAPIDGRGRGLALRPGRPARRVRPGADARLLPAAARAGRRAGGGLRRLQRREGGVREAQGRPGRTRPVSPPATRSASRTRRAEYIYFTAPYPALRVKADWKSYLDLASYEGYTCLKPGTRYGDKDKAQLDRDADGKLVWAWKRDTPPLNPEEQQELIAAGKMKREESPLPAAGCRRRQADPAEQLLVLLERLPQEVHHDRLRGAWARPCSARSGTARRTGPKGPGSTRGRSSRTPTSRAMPTTSTTRRSTRSSTARAGG